MPTVAYVIDKLQQKYRIGLTPVTDKRLKGVKTIILCYIYFFWYFHRKVHSHNRKLDSMLRLGGHYSFDGPLPENPDILKVNRCMLLY